MLRCKLPDPDRQYLERVAPVDREAVQQLEDNPAFQRLLLHLQYKAAKLSEAPFNDKGEEIAAAVHVARGARAMLKEMDAQLSVMRKADDEQTTSS